VRFDVVTLHPDLVRGPLGGSILGRAVTDGRLLIGVHDLRDVATGRHRAVDDAPYGGGAGMVLRVDIVARSLARLRRPDSHVLLMGPGGTRFDQSHARRLASLPHLILVCGHYEGFDARVEALCDEELSIGDYVLTGGEIAACAIVDAVGRLVPGVLAASSPLDESFGDGLLEYGQYTRPRVFGGVEVPQVLVSGHHERIRRWRRADSRHRTEVRRPDLLPASPGAVDGSRDDD
jgi:tRNA (guanine37-N1)-methyltransferase